MCGSLSSSLKSIITDKRGGGKENIRQKNYEAGPFFFLLSFSLLLDVSSATSAYQEFFISLFFSEQKAALDCGWDLMISNTSVSFTVRSTSI